MVTPVYPVGFQARPFSSAALFGSLGSAGTLILSALECRLVTYLSLLSVPQTLRLNMRT